MIIGSAVKFHSLKMFLIKLPKRMLFHQLIHVELYPLSLPLRIDQVTESLLLLNVPKNRLNLDT